MRAKRSIFVALVAAALAPSAGASLTLASAGSGFYVTVEGHFVTNAHVVDDCRAVGVLVADGLVLPARVLASAARPDLALLKTRAAPGPAAALRGVDAQPGEPVQVFGFPSDAAPLAAAISRGVVVRGHGPGGAREAFLTSAPVLPGGSGGPALDAEGRVVGVAAAYLRDDPATGVAVSATALRRFLGMNGVAPARPSPSAPPAAYAFPALCFR